MLKLISNVGAFDNMVFLGYKIDWPVNIVVTSKALNIYADIFSFLMQIRLALYSLSHMWKLIKVAYFKFNDTKSSRVLIFFFLKFFIFCQSLVQCHWFWHLHFLCTDIGLMPLILYNEFILSFFVNSLVHVVTLRVVRPYMISVAQLLNGFFIFFNWPKENFI